MAGIALPGVAVRRPLDARWRIILLGLVLLATFSFVGSDQEPAWAAFPGDEGKIAFMRYGIIRTIHPDGTGDIQLSDDEYEKSTPAWSPDGSKLVYVQVISEDEPDIFLINSDGTGKQNLTGDAIDGAHPAWAPDGQKIVFTSGGALHTINADGTGLDQLTGTGSYVWPAWSPDGSKIAFVRYAGAQTDIWTVDANGSNEVQLTDTADIWEFGPNWSPDGSKLAFSSNADGDDDDISVMDADGSNVVQLTANTVWDTDPAWSPSGNRIAFVSQGRIYVMNSDGSNPVQVTRTEAGGAQPDWQPLQLEVQVSRSIVPYGGEVTVTAHLYWYATTTNTTISIYKEPYGGEKTLVTTGPVDLNGNLTTTVAITKHTRFVAEWSGDDTHAAASSPSTLVRARAIVKTTLRGAYATSGRYKLYHEGDGVRQRGTVLPNHAGDRLEFIAQKRRGGVWRTIARGTFRIGSNGSVVAVFRGDAGTYRANNSFEGDEDHLGARSAWKYFRIVA